MSDISYVRGNLDDFLNALLTQESGIDENKIDFYKANYNNKILTYPQVVYPGRVIRDFTSGEMIYDIVTPKEYFIRIGVDDYIDLDCPKSLIYSKYMSINPLGFVGFQLGEAILISTGYYVPTKQLTNLNNKVMDCKRYYFGGIKPIIWSKNVTEIVHKIPDGNAIIVATDVNRWDGQFTGKNNINSYADLKRPSAQIKVIKDVIRFNIKTIKNLISKNNMASQIQNNDSFFWVESKNIVHNYSLSGIAAAAHLIGAWGTADYLINGASKQDEFGTKIGYYLEKFSYYDLGGFLNSRQ